MKKCKLLIVFMLLLFAVNVATAQRITVTGKVTDANTGLSMPYVTVSVKGSAVLATHTDDKGMFTLITNDVNATLIFSFIGYKTTEINIAGRAIINVNLEPEITELEEAVVIGYGTGKKLGTQVSSVAVIKNSEIAEKPFINTTDALQGKVAGLQIYTSSGEPTAVSSTRLHGIGSIGGGSSELLIVVDGIPSASSIMSSINPTDIENVSVLKDATATAIYGSRASNGVLYITTKRGVTNKDAVIKLRGQLGFSQLASTHFYDNLMNTDELLNFWEDSGLKSAEYIAKIRKEYGNNNTSWGDYMFNSKALLRQYDISVQGGGGRTAYYVSGGYSYQDGILPRSLMERYTGRVNIDSKVKKWLKIGLNIGTSYDKRMSNGWMGNNNYSGITYRWWSFLTPYDKDGKETDIINGTSFYNPKLVIKAQPTDNNVIRVNGLVFGELTPLRGLTLRSQYGTDAFDQKISNKSYPSAPFNNGSGSASEAFYRSTTMTTTNTVEYKFDIQNIHNITLLAGQEFIDHTYTSQSASTSGHTDDRLMRLDDGPTRTGASSSRYEYAYLSFFGRAEYGFSNRYFANFIVRSDRSSRFGKNNQTATFFSGGLMWNIKSENFLKNTKWIDLLKLRLSVGSQGNSDFGDDRTYWYKHLATTGTTTAYQGSPSLAASEPGNSKLTWEKQVLTTVTVNARFFNIVNLDLELYNRHTSSMLFAVPYPWTSGYAEITSNVGSLVNRGIDVSLDFDIVRTKDWYVGLATRLGYNHSKVTKLFLGRDKYIDNARGTTYAVGRPVEMYWPLFAGVDPNDGKPMWYLPGKDVRVQTKDPSRTTKIYSDDLYQNTEKPRYAPVAGGFDINLKWKNFSISTNFSYVLGKYLYNNDAYFTLNPSQFASSPISPAKDIINNYWKKAGDVAKYPDIKTKTMDFDDRLLENASFLRLKSLIVSYTLSKSVLNKTDLIKDVKFFFAGRNLFTVTKYSGQDPEVDANMTLGAYPNTRQYSFGIELTF